MKYTILPILFTIPSLALAYAPSITDPLKNIGTLDQLIVRILKVAMEVGLVAAGIFLVYTGFRFVIARGREEEIKNARRMFFYTIIGTLLIAGALVITYAIEDTIRSLN